MLSRSRSDPDPRPGRRLVVALSPSAPAGPPGPRSPASSVRPGAETPLDSGRSPITSSGPASRAGRRRSSRVPRRQPRRRDADPDPRRVRPGLVPPPAPTTPTRPFADRLITDRLGVGPQRRRHRPGWPVVAGALEVARGADLRHRAAPRGRPLRRAAAIRPGQAGLDPDVRTPLAGGLGWLDRGTSPPDRRARRPRRQPAARRPGPRADRRPWAVPALTALAARRAPSRRRAAPPRRSRDHGRPFESQPSAGPGPDRRRPAGPPASRAPRGRRPPGAGTTPPRSPPRPTTAVPTPGDLGLWAAREASASPRPTRRPRSPCSSLALDRDPAAGDRRPWPPGRWSWPGRPPGDRRRPARPRRAAIDRSARSPTAKTCGEGRPGPLVEALSAPDRRVQFAAAEALVGLDPTRAFAGSSRVVPTLARFVAARPAPAPW